MNAHTKHNAMRPSGATHTADATTVEEGLAIAEAQDRQYNDEMATETAMSNTLLTPRFYTTDFDELDAIDVSPVRADWDKLIDQMQADPNKGHFKKNEDWDHVDWEDGPRPEEGIHRLPDLELHRRIFGLRPLQGNEAPRQQQGHHAAFSADGP